MKQNPSPRPWLIPAIVAALLVIFIVCCMCLVLVGLGAYFFQSNSSSSSSNPISEIFPTQAPTAVPVIIRPTPGVVETASAPLTATLLKDVQVPENDPIRQAQQLAGKGEIPLINPAPAVPLVEGDRLTFWANNSDNNQNFQVEAVLEYQSDNVNFFIEDGVEFNRNDLEQLVDRFDAEIIPINRAFFGSEWSPGVDNDPRLYILLVRNIGAGISGYFSPSDEYTIEANETSNAHEMFYLNADNLELDDDYTDTVLAHEYQHMIHWRIDRNEESWVNEGFSELASFINGYSVGYHDYAYIEDPDIQLTDWPENESGPHYGAAFLYMNYFLNRFGNEATKAVVALPENGMAGIDQVLTALNATDPTAGTPINATDVFADWVVASYLRDESVADGRFTYANYPGAPQAGDTDTFDGCITGAQTRSVSQFGADYIVFNCDTPASLRFEGSTAIPVLPTDPVSGRYYFWSNRGDESNMTLTRAFDFTDHTGAITLSFAAWYDLEKDYDYTYIEVSKDGGETWEILTTPSGTSDNPVGNSYGWGYTGDSGKGLFTSNGSPSWIQEQVDLSSYAGEEILLRFDTITDAAVHGEGFIIDDISIDEIGYFSDFEQDDGGWQGNGYVRLQNELPQTYRLSIITYGDKVEVEKFSLSRENVLEIPLGFGEDVQKVVLVVSGTTPDTRLKTGYRFELVEQAVIEEK